MPSRIGVWCEHCDPKEGCQIYTMRPNECKKYKCMWLQMENAEDELRPDRMHVIFEKIDEEIVLGLQDPDYELNNLAKRQISYFVKNGFSVALVKGEEKEGIYLAKGHKLHEVGRVVNDRSKLYRRFN